MPTDTPFNFVIFMKNITIGIFHDPDLGRMLGKIGTKSDIAMFNRKTDSYIFTFMSPVDDKLIPKSQIIAEMDAAIVSFKEITPEIGETIIMLNSFEIKKGIIIAPYISREQLNALIKGTSLENFAAMERDFPAILDFLSKIEPERKESEPIAVIDHSFSVKGVGDVVLGLVKCGTVKKHDKLLALPCGKEVIIRSIQMQDHDVDEAGPGSRVGFATRGAGIDELGRGTLLCNSDSAKTAKKILLDFNPNKFYSSGTRKGAFHATVGMQTVPVKITEISEGKITIESEKEIVFMPDDTFILLDLNAQKMHIIGNGKPSIK